MWYKGAAIESPVEGWMITAMSSRSRDSRSRFILVLAVAASWPEPEGCEVKYRKRKKNNYRNCMAMR